MKRRSLLKALLGLPALAIVPDVIITPEIGASVYPNVAAYFNAASLLENMSCNTRLVSLYDPITDTRVTRYDEIYSLGKLYPEYSCKIMG